MTIQVKIEVTSTVSNLNLALIEVTPNGLRKARHYDKGTVIGPLSIYQASALLLCEGMTDLSDGTPEDEQDSVSNPLNEYLKRDFPTVPLQDELRQKLADAETQRDRFRRERDEALRKLNAMRSALDH